MAADRPLKKISQLRTLRKKCAPSAKLLRYSLLAIAGSFFLTGCSANESYESWYKDAFGNEKSKGPDSWKSWGATKKARGTSTAYVIKNNKVYYKETEESPQVTCRGLTSPVPDGPDCLGVKVPYVISTISYFPLEIDPAQDKFHSISEDYASDDQHLFYKQFIVKDFSGKLDEKKFHPMPLEGSPSENASSYVSDGNAIFFKDHRVRNPDLDSFKVLYFNSRARPELSAKPIYFRDFAKDKNSVFWRGQALDDSDPATFAVVDQNHVKDGQHVWYVYFDKISLLQDKSKAQNHASPIGNGYSRAQHHSADGKNYAVIQWTESSEKKTLIHKLIDADADSFSLLAVDCKPGQQLVSDHPQLGCGPDHQGASIGEFGRDRQHVFQRDQIIPQADPSSFKIVYDFDDGRDHYAFALDKNAVYSFKDGEFRGRLEIQGPLIGPLPTKYGDMTVYADQSGFIENKHAYMAGGRQDVDICIYEPWDAKDPMKVVSRGSGTEESPLLVIGNDRYRYVVVAYSAPFDADRNYVLQLKTGKKLWMHRENDRNECGPRKPLP